MTEFFLPMIPPTTTHQTKNIRIVNGKPVVYEDAKLKGARNKLTAHLGQHIPLEPYRGGIRMVTKWLFPLTGKHKDGEYRTSKPDTDNLQKMLKDVMTKLGYWDDDALVASEVVEKFWAETPGIYIKINRLNEE